MPQTIGDCFLWAAIASGLIFLVVLGYAAAQDVTTERD